MPPIKCMVLGSTGAGKTTLLRTYINQTLFRWPTPTSYHEYLTKATATNGTKLSMKICDTSGLETFDYESRLHYRNTDVFIICFSITDPGFFGYIRRRWLPHIRECCPNAPVVLVGTKVDLREDPDYQDLWTSTPLTPNEGMRMAKEIGAAEYLECSTRKGIGVSVVFDIAATCALHYRSKMAGPRRRSRSQM